MAETTTRNRFNWTLPIYAAIGAVIIFLPITTYCFDIGLLLYVFVLAPILCLIWLVIAIVIPFNRNWKKEFEVLSMLLVYGLATWALFTNSFELHTPL